MAEAILRLPTVKDRTGLSRSSIYLKVSQGQFPPPISLGARAIGWIESEVQEWIDSQIKKSRKPKSPKRSQRSRQEGVFSLGQKARGEAQEVPHE